MRKLLLILPLSALLAACGAIPQASKPARQAVSQSTVQVTPRPEMRACLSSLSAARAAFTPLPDQYYGAGCSTIGTVRLTSLRSDDAHLQLANLGPVTCPVADSVNFRPGLIGFKN